MARTIIVVEETTTLPTMAVESLSLSNYLAQYPKKTDKKVRVLNLCDYSRYLSSGYYCSLLAEARQHQVIPSVKKLNEFRKHAKDVLYIRKEQCRGMDLPDAQQHLIVLGVSKDIPKVFADKIYVHFELPIMVCEITEDHDILMCRIVHAQYSFLDDAQKEFAHSVILSQASQQQWFKPVRTKKYRWKLAILANPEESHAPSNQGALKRFKRAGHLLGIDVDIVDAARLLDIEVYDGLFIRETTAINHHTYELAIAAEASDLIVMDDPTSILRCCNKVFLHDAFTYQNIPSLKTLIIADNQTHAIEDIENELGYPVVLKLPESAFSKGVYKAKDRFELQLKLTELFAQSALVIVQEYLKTDFDWRIGVLNGRAIYACKYMMARGHWQIYNHSSKRFSEGGFSAMGTFEVPKRVLNAAIKAAGIIGNGLYGVDIKEADGRAYVLEVNDNPSIDHGVEDAYLGNELYMLIMNEFLRRFEARGLSY